MNFDAVVRLLLATLMFIGSVNMAIFSAIFFGEPYALSNIASGIMGLMALLGFADAILLVEVLRDEW